MRRWTTTGRCVVDYFLLILRLEFKLLVVESLVVVVVMVFRVLTTFVFLRGHTCKVLGRPPSWADGTF